MKMHPLIAYSLNVLSVFGIFTFIIAEILAENLSAPYLTDLPDKDPLNKIFSNDVRALIKRRLNENADIKKFHFEINSNQIYRDNSSSTVSAFKTISYVPSPVLVDNWPVRSYTFGQITAVSVDGAGNPVIFHRADRYWDVNTFSETHNYYMIKYGPIQENTIFVLDAKSGSIRSGWGDNFFYLPHGMSIDTHGNYWITDVAMHQGFKFRPHGTQPMLTFGKRFIPGSSINHLCKPTSIAVSTTGEVFIADGYCNQRILKFNAAGRLLRVIPQPPEFLSLQVPHAITLLEHLDLLCIADRENMRVVCPKAGLKSSEGEGQPAATIQEPDLGRVFGVAAYGNIVYAVNGPTSMLPVRGFTIDPRSETIIGHWGEFKNPHSIAVCANGSALYVSEIGTNSQRNRIWKYVLV